MRYNIFFPNGIDLSILPKKEGRDFLSTLESDKVVDKNDVLISEFLNIVSIDLTNKEVHTLRKKDDIIIEIPKKLELLTDITINGEEGWSYPNEWSDLISGIDYFYNNPDANPSTHNFFGSSTGEIINTHIDHYNIKSLWSRNFKGQGVKVAILDTGCAIGQNNDVEIAGGVNVGDSSSSYADTIGHGTAMASIIGGRKNGSGMVGFAPLATLYSVKVFGTFGNNPIYGISDALLAGLEWCFYNDIDVINISLSWGGYSSAMQAAINKLVEKGVLIFCAAGNGLWSAPHTQMVYPASYKNVFSISGKRGGLIFNYEENLTFTNVLTNTTTGKSLDYLLEPWVVEAKNDGSIAKTGYGSSQSNAGFAGIGVILKQRFPFHSQKQLKKFLDRHAVTGTHGYKYFNNLNFIKGRALVQNLALKLAL